METVVDIKKTKGTPTKCRDCGNYVGTKGTISRNPKYAILSSDEHVCLDCAHNYEWDESLLTEAGFTYNDLSFDAPDFDLNAPVEPGFVKAMKYSHYTRLAYRLGLEKGKTDEPT